METLLTPYTAREFIPATAVLVFAPHPDDEAIGCGGLLSVYAQNSIPVDVIFLTSGEFGEHGHAGPEARESESVDACNSLSIRHVSWWREPDRGVKYHEAMIDRAVDVIAGSGADLVLCPGINELHPDHRTTAWLVIEAARRLNEKGSSVSVAMYEVGAPLHYVNALIDISAVVDDKRKAIKCYKSQLDLYSYDELILGLNQYRSYTLNNDVKYAEAYRLLAPADLRQPVLLAEPEVQRQERLHVVTITPDCPKVSVLMRSMGRDTLARALDSVALQTWPNIEVLVLNASGAAHPEVLNHVGGFPLRFIDSGHGLKRAAAANELLDQADGDFALFLDDDDWIAPDHVASLVQVLQDSSSVVAAYSGVQMGVLQGAEWRPDHTFNADFDRNRLLFENYLPIHSVLFRLPDVRDRYACRFDTELEVFEDWDFWLQLSQQTDMLPTGHVSAYYCRNQSEGSEVFETTEANDAQREKLRAKWFDTFSLDKFGQLLDYIQCEYRARNVAEQALASQISGHAATLKELTVELASVKEVLKQRENEIKDFSVHVSGLEKILAQKDAEIFSMSRQLSDLEVWIEDLKKAATDKDKIIMAREIEISNFKDHVSNLESMVKEKDADISELSVHISEKDEILERCQAQFSDLLSLTRNRKWLLSKLIKPED